MSKYFVVFGVTGIIETDPKESDMTKWTTKASSCCDWKARAAYAQSFTLWQQATIEFTRRDHSHGHHQEVQSTVHQVHKHC